MKAVVYDTYGGAEMLRIGSPLYARIGGLRSPACRTLGSDIAGSIAAIGPGISLFAVGDAVYGDNLTLKGGFAEYAVAPESALALKPNTLTHKQASTIPQAGAIALQGMARAGPGSRILINGAGGGSGAFAIQLAKRAGAHVTAVDNARKLAFMRSLGADEVIDYRAHNFTKLCSAGVIDIHIDRAFILDEVADALDQVGSGRALGKVVVTVA